MLWSIGGSNDELHDAGCCSAQPVAFDNLAASAASWKADATGSPEEKVNMQKRGGDAEAMRLMRREEKELSPKARQPTASGTGCARSVAARWAACAVSKANTFPLLLKNTSTLRWAGASVMKMSFEMGCDWIQSSRLSMKAAAQPSNSGARC
jgi:hypothetical protein